MSEKTLGRDPIGSGSHLLGEATDVSSSLRDFDPSRIEAAAEALYWWEVHYRDWPHHSWATLAVEAPHSQARFRAMARAALTAAFAFLQAQENAA